MGSARFEPLSRVGGVDASADLHTTGPHLERFARCCFIPVAQHPDVAAAEAVVAVAFGIPGARVIALVVDRCRAVFGERRADDLNHFAMPKIDAGTEHIVTVANAL